MSNHGEVTAFAGIAPKTLPLTNDQFQRGIMETQAKTAEAALAAAEHLRDHAKGRVPQVDMVNHPPHYTAGAVECIDAIHAADAEGFIAYCKGNVIKYLWRAGRKGNPVQDLEKAEFYLKRAIKAQKESQS